LIVLIYKIRHRLLEFSASLPFLDGHPDQNSIFESSLLISFHLQILPAEPLVPSGYKNKFWIQSQGPYPIVPEKKRPLSSIGQLHQIHLFQVEWKLTENSTEYLKEGVCAYGHRHHFFFFGIFHATQHLWEMVPTQGHSSLPSWSCQGNDVHASFCFKIKKDSISS